MDNYSERLKTLSDSALLREWAAESDRRVQVEHEMADRWRHPAPIVNHARNKIFDLQEKFMAAYRQQDWFTAKYIYDTAIRVCMFLDLPEPFRNELFGISGEDEPEIQGMFPRDVVSRVYEECVVKDGLGHECVVYRIPGEIAFYGGPKGAKKRPETTVASWDQLMRRMRA